MAKVLSEPEGFIGMMMTGFIGLLGANLALMAFAWFLNPYIYNIAGSVIRSISSTIAPGKGWFAERGYKPLGEGHVSQRRMLFKRVRLAVIVGVLLLLHVVRPKSPYGHMSNTLPFTLFEGLFVRRSEFCDPSPWNARGFPLKKGLGEEFWVKTKEEGGLGRGWTPGKNWWEVERKKPEWLPEKGPVDGFAKYYRGRPGRPPPPPPPPPMKRGGEHGAPPPPPPPPGYDSVLDPLKISNLDQPILEELQKALKDRKIDIKHIVIMSLESTRKDVFPLIKGDTLEKHLQESRRKPSKRDESSADADSSDSADLSQLSPMAETLTGQSGGWDSSNSTASTSINLQNALTGSTFTLKSLLGSHCGVVPLPVDFLEELETEIYQPCLPQILSVMNSQNLTTAADNYRTFPWKSSFMMSATDKFDRTGPFIKFLGFESSIVREDILDPAAKHPPTGPEINYFGYSETELLPYIRDLFEDAKKNNERVFLSHLTSSTHHPWATPSEFGPQQRYWGGRRGGGTPWDRYLNSVKWGNQWIKTFMDLLTELGVADETLVVMVGDHGFSFSDDSHQKTTYANSHINSFRVPLLFHHPALPGLQIQAKTSSLAILPTILDLLDQTKSLPDQHIDIAEELLPEYEGQSLIRPFIASKDGRDIYNLGVINPGGTHLSLTSASTPFRLVVPICEPVAYSFTQLTDDPGERSPVEDWDGGNKLRLKVSAKWGREAGQWVSDAEKVAGWLVWELRRRWGYWDGARREDRGAGHNDDGLLEHDHWWDT